MRLNRRKLLKIDDSVAQALSITSIAQVGDRYGPAGRIGNPLEAYPDRRWEEVYRDQYEYTRNFSPSRRAEHKGD